MHQIRRGIMNLPNNIWKMTVRLLKEPTKMQRYFLAMSILLYVPVFLDFSNLHPADSFQQFIQQPIIVCVYFVPFLFLIGTIIKNMITNKGNVICFNLSFCLVLFELLCSFIIKRRLWLNVNDIFLIVSFFGIYFNLLLFFIFMFLDYFEIDLSEVNRPDVKLVGDRIIGKNGFIWWVLHSISQVILLFTVISAAPCNCEKGIGSGFFEKTISNILILAFPSILFSFFVLAREYMRYRSYNRLQRKKTRLNTTLFLMQFIVLFEFVCLTIREEDILVDLQALACIFIFASSIIISLINSYYISEYNRETNEIHLETPSIKKYLEIFVRKTAVFLLGCAAVVTITMLLSPYYDLNAYIEYLLV